MAEHGGFGLSDLGMEDKLKYKKLLDALKKEKKDK
jgi:hypothetical protein